MIDHNYLVDNLTCKREESGSEKSTVKGPFAVRPIATLTLVNQNCFPYSYDDDGISGGEMKLYDGIHLRST